MQAERRAEAEPMEKERRHKEPVEHAHKRRHFILRANDARAGEIARVSGNVAHFSLLNKKQMVCMIAIQEERDFLKTVPSSV